MTTVQMRRYQFAPGDIDGFLVWWRGVVPVYEQFSFDVVFAFIDRDNEELVWAVSYPDDVQGFRDAKAVLSSSPEWATATAGPRPRAKAEQVSFVEVEVPPHP